MIPRISRPAVTGLRLVSRRQAVQQNVWRHATASRSLSATATVRQDTEQRERKWSTPLAKRMADAIAATGPMSLATYMRMCLTSDTGGYYTGAVDEQPHDQFGRKGDFVTSPEISQMFGELVGIWFVAEWISQGRPDRGVELIEVGPGRGTMMDDMLRTIQSFPDMAHAIDAIYMVEASAKLRVAQKNLLCGEDAPMTESKVGYHSICKYTQLPIVWTETIKSIPYDEKKTPFIVAHEFFDALPIHVFELVDIPPNRSSDPRTSPDGNASSGSAQDPSPAEGQPTDEGPDHSAPSTKTARSTLQWREMLVTPSPPDATHASLGTPPSLQRAAGGVVPDFQLSRARNHTRHSRYLPDSSARYRAIKAAASRLSPTDPVSRGGASAVIEVSPDASLYASDFATRIGGSPKHPKHRASGAALIIDYGPGDGTVPRNTLRGIRRHELVSPFVLPGAVDLSADVDFAAIAESALRASEGVEVHGPVEQGVWLEGMGIRERAKALMEGSKRGSSGNDVKEKVERALSRLVDRGVGGMGRLYKVLAILPENEGRRRPVGFGGDVDV